MCERANIPFKLITSRILKFDSRREDVERGCRISWIVEVVLLMLPVECERKARLSKQGVLD